MSNTSVFAILVMLGINATLGSETEARELALAIGSGNPAALDQFIIENQNSVYLSEAIHLSTQNRSNCDLPGIARLSADQKGSLGYSDCGGTIG